MGEIQEPMAEVVELQRRIEQQQYRQTEELKSRGRMASILALLSGLVVLLLCIAAAAVKNYADHMHPNRAESFLVTLTCYGLWGTVFGFYLWEDCRPLSRLYDWLMNSADLTAPASPSRSQMAQANTPG